MLDNEEMVPSSVIWTGGDTGIELDAEGAWYYDTETGIRMPYADYVAVTAPLGRRMFAVMNTRNGEW